MQGVKTLWPSHYKPIDVVRAVKEVMADPKNLYKENAYCGYANDGIKTMAYLDPNGNILSAFPCWD